MFFSKRKNGFDIKINIEFAFKNYSNLPRTKEIALHICSSLKFVYPNTPKGKGSIFYKYIHEENDSIDLQAKMNIKNILADKITLQVSFWTHDINKKDDIISDFYKKLLLSLEKNNIEPA